MVVFVFSLKALTGLYLSILFTTRRGKRVQTVLTEHGPNS